jgi:hypothetical protein
MEFPLRRLKESWVNGVVAAVIIAGLGIGVYMLGAVSAGIFAWGAVRFHLGSYSAGAVVGWIVSLAAIAPIALGEALRLVNKARGWVGAAVIHTH